MNPPTMYGEGSCTSWNPTGNRSPQEEDAFWNSINLAEACRRAGTHNPVIRDGYVLHTCSRCGGK